MISFWQSEFPSVQILSKPKVRSKVNNVISRVQKMISKNEYSPNKSNPVWIETERNFVLNRVFDIGIESPVMINIDATSTNVEASGSGTKRKAVELVSKIVLLLGL